MTSYRAHPPYDERKHSWEEPGLMHQRRDHEDYLYGHSLTGYCVDSGRPRYDQDENYLENGRRDYIEYRDYDPDLRERESNYRHFEREDRKTPLLQDFRRNEESARDPYPESSRNSRFYDNLDEYIREQRELMNADHMPRGRKPGVRSLLDLEPLIYEDDRSRDYDRDYRSRGYLPEERSRDYGHRSRHDDSDGDYRCGDYCDDYRRDESRTRTEELDYRDNVAPRRHDYHRQPARDDPCYQRDWRNEHDKRDEDVLYGYRDRHHRYNEREFRKQVNEYSSHERANSRERDRGRRGREYSYVDRDKYPISSRMVHNERPARSDVRSYDNEPERGTEIVEPICKRERRSSREEYAQYPSRQTRRARGGRPSRSPGIPSKAYSNNSSPTRPSPTSSGRVSTRENYPKRKMSMYEMNGTKRRKCDGRQTNASPKKQDTPSSELITRDQFLSRDVFNSKKHSSHVPEDKSTKTKDLGFRDNTSSRHSCGEHDLRHELSESRAAASGTKSPHLDNSSDFEERSSTASSARIIDSESSSIRSVVQVPKKKLQKPNESHAKIKKEVEIYSDSAQTKRSITPDPVIKPLAKQVSTPSCVNTATGQPVRTSEGIKRKVSICPTRTPSPLLGAFEKPKVELPADDLRLLIMSRRLRQSEQTTPSLDDNLNHKNEEPTMLPQPEHPRCQVSNHSQGSADGMVELSYSEPEGSANEDSASPTPKGQACRTVVMRRQVILDYGHERSHPRTSHQSPDKEKGKENKVDKEKESSGTPIAVVEVVSQGAANPPVLTNRPLYKKEDSKILSTVEVVDNSPESSLDSHAADESQTSEESIREVTSYEVRHSLFGHATADVANSSVVYTQKYGYLQQIEDVSNQEYSGPETKENVAGIQESEHFEESNGPWTTSTGRYEIERQTYQELGLFEEESDAVRENTSVPHEDEQQSVSHFDQEFSQEVGHCPGESDAGREDLSDYNREEQHISHYGQEYSQELGYNTEVGDDLRDDPPECYEEQHNPQYEQEYSQELGYNTEVGDDVREDPPECYEEQHIPHYGQEYSQELGYNTEVGDDVREDPPECYEEQHIPHYGQEYSQELGYNTEVGDDLREDPPECYEEQHIPHYGQEYSQELVYNTEVGDDVREDPPECYEEQHIPHYGQEYSQELVYNTEVGDDLREDPPECYEEQHNPQYEQEYSQEPGDGAEESDHVRENHLENLNEDQSISHYEQESYQELGGFSKEGDAVKEGYTEHYDDPSTPQYDRPSYLGHDHFQEESDAWRKNSLEERSEQQSVSHYKQEYSQELGSHNDENDDVGESTSESYEEQQPVSHYEQGISQDVGKEDGSEEIRQDSPESYEGQPVPDYEKEADNSDSTDKDNESSLETFQDEKDENEQESFSELEQFAGMTDRVSEGFSEQEDLSCDYDEESSETGDDDESFSSGEESYQSATDEVKYCTIEDSDKQHENHVSERRHGSYGNVFPEASFSGYKASDGSKGLLTSSHQYEHASERYEYDDDSDEIPEMSNGFDVILALDGVDYDDMKHANSDFDKNDNKDDADDKIATTINYEHSASKCDGIGRSDDDPDEGKEDVNESDEAAPQDNGGAIGYDGSNECGKKGIPDDGLNTGTEEEAYQTGEHHSAKYENNNEKYQESDGCEIQCLGLKCLPCNSGETEAQKSRPPVLKWSSVSEHDDGLPTRDYGSKKANENVEQQQSNQSTDLLNKSSGSEYDPALPTKDSGCVNIQNGYRHDGTSTLPTKDNVSSQVTHLVIDSQELRHLADRYKSSSSEYDTIPTKDCDVTVEEEDDQNDDAFQELPHPDQDLDNCSSPEIVVCMPAESGVTHEQDYRKDDLDKVSGSEMDLHTPKNDCAVTNEQDYPCQNVAQDALHPVYSGKSNGSESVYVFRNDVTIEQDYRSDDVIHNVRSPVVNKSSGSENVRISANDRDVVNEQNYDSDDVIHDLRSSGSETDGRVVTTYCDVEFVQNNHDDDAIQVCDIDKSRVSQSTDCEITDEQDIEGKDITQELRQPDLNESIEDKPPLQSKYVDNISNSDELIEVAYPGSLGTITEKVGAHQSPAESNAMPVVHKALDAQECIVDSCNSDTTSSYEVVVEEVCRVLGATAEIFLPSDIDANHICIYECVDFQLLCVHYPAPTTSDQGPKQLYHNLQSDKDVRQKDLPSGQITPAKSQGSSNSAAVAAPVRREECVIEERKVVQNQVHLICSPINDEDQIASQEESSRSRLNDMEATSQNANECESVELGDLVDEENPTVTLPDSNTGMSQKSCSSRGEIRKEIDDPDLMYLDEVQYFEGEQPIGKSKNTGKAKSSNQNISAEDVSDDTCGSRRCDSSNDSAGEMSLFSSETNVSEVGSSTSQSEMMLKLRQEFDRWTQNDGQQGSDYLFTETNYSCLSDSSDAAIQDQPYDPECASLNQASFSDMSSDAVPQDQPYDPECASLNQASFSDMSSDAVPQDQPYDPECASLNQASFSDMSSDAVPQDQPYDPECASLNQASFSDMSSDAVPQEQPYDPECVSLSDMSLETPSTSSQVSPKCSQVPAYVSPKTQRAVSTMRTSSSKPSPCDISLYSQSTSARVPNMHEDGDLKSRKPYDPANCLMDVDTFSELSGMSLDTPSTSAVEYVATEADTTLVGVEDDDSEPYTPEAYSRSPENDSEPYTPEAYSPVLSLSGDESDPELFSCRYMDDASTPYNPASHCPADMSMSGASGNEADNEVSTGFSSPEFSTNQSKHLSLKLKKPSAQKLRWSYVGNSSKESSNDDTLQKNPEVYSPESFVPLFKPAAGGKSSNRKSARLHSRSKSDDVERRKQQEAAPKDNKCSVGNEKPCALPPSKKSERSRGKERKSKQELTTTGSKRKPLKSLVTIVGTNKRVKEDEVKKKVDHHAGTKTKKKSATKGHNSKAIPKIPKEKESVKRPAISETNETEATRERSTPPLKKPKLASPSPVERRRSSGSPGADTAQQHKKKPSERRNSREEKFKKPVSPGKCKRGRRSSEHAKDAGQKKTTRKSSEVRRKGCSKAGNSFPVLDKLKTIMKDKSSKGTKSPESSPATKNTPTKAQEPFDELHLLDEGHELLELALEESIDRSRPDKSLCAKRSLNLAEKVDKMKRKLAETEEISGNEKMNSTQSFKPSEQETQVQLAYGLDNADDRGVGKAVKTLSEASLDKLKASNQNLPIRLMNDNYKSTELAIKCSGGETDAIDSGMGTGSKKNDKDLGRENTMGVAFQENFQNFHDDGCGWVTKDNGAPANKNVVSSAIEKLEDSKTEIQSATEIRPTSFQETVGEPVEVNIVSSDNEKRMNKQDGDGQASDKENRLVTSTNPGSARSEETGKILIADKSSLLIKDNESDTVGEHDQRIRESDTNSCKDNHQEISAEDSCEVSEEVTNTLSAFSVISSPMSKYLSHGKSSRKVCGKDSEMSGKQLAEDKAGKTVIANDEVGEVQIDRLSKDEDEKPSKKRRGNENNELHQDKDDWSKDGVPSMEKHVAEKNELDQKSNDWSTESISDMTNASCTSTSRNAEKLNMEVMGAKTSNEITDDQNAAISPNNDEQGVTCLPTLQRSRTNKENQFVINAFCATIERELIIPYSDKDAGNSDSSNQCAAKSLATPWEIASTPHVQTEVSSTPSEVSCAQMVQVAGDDSASPGKVRTPEAQPEDDGPLTPIGLEVEDPRMAISSTSVEPSVPKKNLNGKQAGMDGKAQESEVVTSSVQSIEEKRDVKSEISLEEYIEAQLQHGLSLPDISVSKVSSETIPSLPPISFPSPTATPSVSNNSPLSSLKLSSSSSAMKFQKTDLSAASSKVEKGEVSKETPPAPSARGERSVGSPKMDIVRSLTAEYEQKIIAILQKRVDVEKAYREECAKIVNTVKALARKKKNMERELRDVLQTSLRKISQKYISELQRFVRNETI